MQEDSSDAIEKRGIPSVDEVLRSQTGKQIQSEFGRDAALRIVRESIEKIRRENGLGNTRDATMQLIESKLLLKKNTRDRSRLQRVINATGVIIHTNLGRSPLSEHAVRAIVQAAGYCNVEMDLETGGRGRRGASAEKLLAQICGVEDGLIVNNCAAASLLVLSALAKGGEVIVSRGELVEIGGDFRIPDVLEQSGCRLREVGTTNRTKLSDYELAITAETKAILRVHPSNYRITGFTETPDIGLLADLAHRRDLILFEDAGSGALLDLSDHGLEDEPIIAKSIGAGADIVAFSGDKLIGGVQAGLLVGNRRLIESVRRHPLYRALRTDKITYSAIGATLASFARESAIEDIPILRMLSMSFTEIDLRARDLIKQIENQKPANIFVELINGKSAVGGGAGTGVELESSLVAIGHSSMSADELAAAFRQAEIPIIARVKDDRVLVDLRTVHESEEPAILDAIKDISAD